MGLHVHPNSSYSRRAFREINVCHTPAGSPAGGQFCSQGIQLKQLPIGGGPPGTKPVIRQQFASSAPVSAALKNELHRIANDQSIPDKQRAGRLYGAVEKSSPRLVEAAEKLARQGVAGQKEFEALIGDLSQSMGYRVHKIVPGADDSHITDDPHNYAIIGPVKTLERIAVKAATDYNGDTSQVKDVIRGTLAVNSIEEMNEALLKLANCRGCAVVTDSLKDNTSKPLDSGYRDMNVLIRLPNSRLLAEIQIIAKPMMRAKSVEGGHKLYEQWRVLDKSSARAKELHKQMEALYGRAWKKIGASKAALAKLTATVERVLKTGRPFSRAHGV